MHLEWLDPDGPPDFPPVAMALDEPDGLLAAGGRLTPDWLVAAYRRGIFPWFGDGDPILWWAPATRCVFLPGDLRVPRRFRRQLRKKERLSVHLNDDFDAVVEHCARIPRSGQDGTWITAGMQAAYRELHRSGHAASVSVRRNGNLVGGLYGVTLGRIFCGESMFSLESGGSKVALMAVESLMHRGVWDILDAQVPNPHLSALGARQITRPRFLRHLSRALQAGDGAPHVTGDLPLHAILQDTAASL